MITVHHFNRNATKDLTRGEVMEVILDAKLDAVRLAIKEGRYIKVASVATDDLERAFELTNTINVEWTRNKGVTKLCDECLRSTSVGDVMEMDGKFFVVAPLFFTQLN